MKEGWEIKKLGEIAYIGLGFTHTPEYVESGVPFLSVKDISSGEICWDNVKFVSQEEYDSAPKGAKPQKGDIMFCRVGTMGNPVIVTTDTPFCTFVSLGYLHLLNNNISNVYIKYWMQSNAFDIQVKANVKGVTIKNLNTGWLKEFTLPIPPIAEQEKIVAELDCLSGIIEKKKQQLKEYDALAQSIFYEMFGDPVENEKGWEMKKLGEVGELARGVSKHRPRNAPELLGGNTPLIQTGDIANAGMYITKYNSTYSELGLSQSKLWPSGTLCITIAATIGKCSVLTFDSCFPDSVVGYIVDCKCTNNEYIYYIFGSLQKILEENAPAVAQKNINLKTLNELLIPIPPLALQQEFASKIEAIEKQKALIKKSIEEVETLFNSRMDQYFN